MHNGVVHFQLSVVIKLAADATTTTTSYRMTQLGHR